MKKIKIGILADGGDAGGGRTHILTLCENLPKAGFEIFFFSIGSGALSHTVDKMPEIMLTEYPIKRKMDPKILYALRKWTKENGIEILHTHGLKANMYGRLALWRNSIPILTTYHSNPLFDYDSRLAGFVFAVIDQLTIHRSDQFIAVSYEIATQLEKRGIQRKKITIVKNGVNPIEASQRIQERNQWRNEIRSQLSIPQDAKVIGSLGRLVKVKGYPQIITIFKSIYHQSKMKPFLLIIGGGAEEKNLKALVTRFGLEPNVIFVGFQRNPYPYLYASDIMLYSPKAEALGISILESMNTGIPVVAKRVGGIRELIVDEYNGNIKKNHSEIVSAILDLFELPDKQNAFVQNGYAMIQSYFSNQIMMKKTIHLYRKIKKDRIYLLGIPIDNVTKSEALGKAYGWLETKICHQVSTLNIEMLNKSINFEPLRNALLESDLVLPDGMSILKLGRASGEFFSERVPGIEFSEALLQYANQNNLRVYFLGGKQQTIEKLKSTIPARFPNLIPVGYHNGYFGPEENGGILQNIKESNPDILFVGMGMGRQEAWIHQYKNETPAKIAVGVGGSMDVWAGNIRRAPQLFIQFNLEWLYRVLLQPGERIKRLLATLPCIFLILKENKMKYRRILISGYYGYGNIGDEAILNSLLRDIRSIETNREISVAILSSNPHATSTITDAFAIYRFAPFSVLKEIRDTNGLISGGGGLIQDVTSWKSPLYYLGIILMAKIFGKNRILYANGMGPLLYKGNRWLTRFVLNTVKRISVRDHDSQNLLQSIGVRHAEVTIDPIFSLDRSHSFDSYSQYNDFIAISFGPNRDTVANKLKIAAFLDFVSSKTGKMCLFTPFYPTYDRSFSRSIQKEMKTPSVVIETFCPPEEMISILKRCAFGIGMRLHFLIFLALLNKPILPYLYDPKVKTFSQMLSLHPVLDKSQDGGQMEDFFDQFYANLQNPIDFSPIVSKLREQNNLNISFLEDFLTTL